MKIGVIIGSIRDGRKGAEVADWVVEHARELEGVDVERIDLKEFDIPLLTSATLPAMANRQYDSPSVTTWSRVIDGCDGFVFVTPEYNYGIPGAFKNAVDSIGPEWNRKTVAFVAYGADGGIRSTQQWRQIVANFQMLDVRAALALSLFHDFDGGAFAPSDRRVGELTALFEQLVGLTEMIQP